MAKPFVRAFDPVTAAFLRFFVASIILLPFFLLAVFVWSFYIITSRRALTEKHYSPLSVAAVSIFASCAIFFLLSVFTWNNSYTILLVQPKLLLLVLHSALIVTILTYLLFQWALKHSSAATVSLKQFLEPIFAVVFNFLFLGERLTAGFFLGSILIFAGVFIATGTTIWRQATNWVTRNVS